MTLNHGMGGRVERHLAFALVGLPTWALIDGTWALLSQLADRVPEGYNISAYLILSLTLGNIVPLASNSLLKSMSLHELRVVMGCILGVGFSCGIGMSLLWHVTVDVAGHGHSVLFCLLFFVVGACSSTSNVTHFTYVSGYASNETTALSTGMAVGSMLAGVLGILQGAFLEQVGMTITASYVVVASFFLPGLILLWSKASLVMPDTWGEDSHPLLLEEGATKSESCPEDVPSDVDVHSLHKSLLLLQVCNCAFGYGIVPSLISPVCSRFSSSSTVLLLATGTSCILDAICRAFTAVRPVDSPRGIRVFSAGLYVMASALIAAMALPSDSRLLTAPYGGAYAVLLYVGFGVTFGYINLSVFLYIKKHTPPEAVQEAYRWAGVMSQAGALGGSLLSFLLVVSGAVY